MVIVFHTILNYLPHMCRHVLKPNSSVGDLNLNYPLFFYREKNYAFKDSIYSNFLLFILKIIRVRVQLRIKLAEGL